jgi:hypothetical protein
MKSINFSLCRFIIIFCFLLLQKHIICQTKSASSINYVQALKDTLVQMENKSDNLCFKRHCNSIIEVINAQNSLSKQDTLFIRDFYNNLNNSSIVGNGKILESYINRQRPFILSWQSPTDGNTSFSLLKVPRDWNPENEYPLYIELHGLWSVADDPINYLTYPFLNSASSSFAFEDGYYLSPWGRGNFWYQGISETDIWECIATLKSISYINPQRVYLCGHSMGGYGAWSIASQWSDSLAALGIHAGALWYDNSSLVNTDIAEKLKNIPTYFVVGTQDGLFGINETAYQLLQDAGNENIEFVTFNGAHDYLQQNVENMYLWMKNFVNTDLLGSNEPMIVQSKSLTIFPNPVLNEAQISYVLKSGGIVKLDLLNQSGQLVQCIVRNYESEGEHIIRWKRQENLSPGVYFISLKSNNLVKTEKLLIF